MELQSSRPTYGTIIEKSATGGLKLRERQIKPAVLMNPGDDDNDNGDDDGVDISQKTYILSNALNDSSLRLYRTRLDHV